LFCSASNVLRIWCWWWSFLRICGWALVFLLISSVRCSLITLEKLAQVFTDSIFGE
jgi:hypothetical protein